MVFFINIHHKKAYYTWNVNYEKPLFYKKHKIKHVLD